ncbi:MAG: hypothetical protein GX763_09920 [Clostridiaceae bacterium]|nr:hypothetical protein [Clostridiaceae bacterium]
MFDWNRDGKVDPVDIDIWLGYDDDNDNNSPITIDLNGHTFSFVQELEPKRNFWGKIKEFSPQAVLFKKDQKPLHRFGLETFCRFSLNSSRYYGAKGVYALLDETYLLYVGKTDNLAQRINYDYGLISAKDCYLGSPETNCKINSLIRYKYQNGERTFLFFLETDNADVIEQDLVNSLRPPVNLI